MFQYPNPDGSSPFCLSGLGPRESAKLEDAILVRLDDVEQGGGEQGRLLPCGSDLWSVNNKGGAQMDPLSLLVPSNFMSSRAICTINPTIPYTLLTLSKVIATADVAEWLDQRFK